MRQNNLNHKYNIYRKSRITFVIVCYCTVCMYVFIHLKFGNSMTDLREKIWQICKLWNAPKTVFGCGSPVGSVCVERKHAPVLFFYSGERHSCQLCSWRKQNIHCSSLGCYRTLLSCMNFYYSTPWWVLSILPPAISCILLSFHTLKFTQVLSHISQRIIICKSIAWWMMLFYPSGAQIQVCKSVHCWCGGSWGRLPAWCWCFGTYLLSSPALQPRTRPGGPSGPAVRQAPHQAAQ